MPHFVIDCSADVLELIPAESLLKAVHDSAHDSDLFDEENIKVRIQSFEHALVGGEPKSFVHVAGDILDGRSTDNKAQLAQSILTTLSGLMPYLKTITVGIREYQRAVYAKR